MNDPIDCTYKPHSGAPGGIAIILTALVALSFLPSCARKPLSSTPIPGMRGMATAGAPLARDAFSDAAATPGEELWIITRSISDNGSRDHESPGSGVMLTRPPGAQTEVPLPLKHTEVNAAISAYIATVDVTQHFHNPYDEKIEAVYVFPLPHNAAVNEFLMTIGPRRIRGIIRERREAERIYRNARRQGYLASLLTEERPNIFTQSIANIEPGREIDVRIRYFHTLAYADGWYEFVFPMVVGPRFNPPGGPGGTGAAGRDTAGSSRQPTGVSYLKPDERSGHDISLGVQLDAGVVIEESLCRTHVVTRESAGPGKLTVILSPEDRIPNRDFVLRYRVAGDWIKSGLLTYRDERGSFFTLMLYPPRDLRTLERQSLEMVFVLDCSGSMSGRPLAQAKTAIAEALRRLRPDDTFQLIRFSNDASQLGPAPVAATPQNLRRGFDYLESLDSEGGTMMIEGIKAALDFPHDPRRLRFVCFLTDGYIGNESEILAAIQKRIGASRIFSFGVGTAVNRYLLDHMAALGCGAVAYLGPNDPADEVMAAFLDRIAHPALTDLRIDWSALQASEIFPPTLPDLFVGRPVILAGRFRGAGPAPIRVTGRVAGQPAVLDIDCDPGDPGAPCTGLPGVWARMKIADLAGRMAVDPDETLPAQIKQVALDYGLLSAFTAFVAVDTTRRTQGDQGTTVPVAVPVPDGVRYETTVKEE